MNLKKLVVVFSCLMILIWHGNSFAQTSSRSLNNIQVDELTDGQVRQLVEQLRLGTNDANLEKAALSKGMKLEEVKKLRRRFDRLKRNDENIIEATDNDSLKSPRDTLLIKDTIPKVRSKIFGSDLFSGTTTTFEPNLRLATPQNYQVGPDDELLIDIYGYSEASYNLKVNAEGTINIPYVGVVQVGGMTIEQATARIRTRLSTIYSGIRSGNTNVRITIGNIRSIKVVLTGEIIKPGTYTLPSVATIFNALYQSGGPSENGSFRVIDLVRAGKKIASVDLYDFLLEGQFKSNIRLQDNDVIRVPTYVKRVEIVGEIKRPGIFEMVDNEDLGDLLRFAGDFTGSAYKARIKVLKNTQIERKISDIVSENFTTYLPSNGDKFFVDKILDRFENRITIEGAVFRPGEYELEKGLTLSQLIVKAEGLREDAFPNRGHILRLKDDLQTELISFNVTQLLNGQIKDIPLKREDVISISSIFDLKEEYFVNIQGEIRQPGRIMYAEGMTLEDAILQAGGLKESATAQRVEISRRVRNSDALSASARTAEVFQVDINQNLLTDAKSFTLLPFDIIVVRPSAGYEVQRLVRIQGEVLFPGLYTINKKDERLSDLLIRAGGLTAQAFPEGASLRRPEKPLKDLIVNRSGDYSIDSIPATVVDEVNRNEFVGINLPRIINTPYSKYDIFLEEGDIVNIPRQLQTVKVNGQVLSPSTVIFTEEKGFLGYIAGAGGFTDRAKRKRSFIKYANGAVKSTRQLLFFNDYPRVQPGSEIIVPVAPPKKPINIGELVAVTSSIVTLILLFSQINGN